MSVETFRRTAAGYMSAAAKADDADQQAQLVSAAAYWHTLALEAEAKPELAHAAEARSFATPRPTS